jgi:2-polyprenyl-3-methyl-5-hydroxy-6-metoxy-1,4-benzoquinol methylase
MLALEAIGWPGFACGGGPAPCTLCTMSDELLQLVAARYASQREIDKYVGRAHAGLLPWEQVIEARFLRPPGRLLDIGCGAGREAFALSSMGHTVSAIDINPGLVDAARRAAVHSNQSIDFRVTDGQQIPFTSDSFHHAIIWSQVLGNVPRADARAALLTEVGSRLHQNGTLTLSVHERTVGERIAREKGLILDDIEYELEDGDFIERGDSPSATSCYWHYFYKEELSDLVRAAGLQVVECNSAPFYGQIGWDVLLVLVARRIAD